MSPSAQRQDLSRGETGGGIESRTGGVQQGTQNELTVWRSSGGVVVLRDVDGEEQAKLTSEQAERLGRLCRSPPDRPETIERLVVSASWDLLFLRGPSGRLLTCLGTKRAIDLAKLLDEAAQRAPEEKTRA